MDKTQFIKDHALELLFFGEEVDFVRAILKDVGTHYVLDIKESPTPGSSSVHFTITCPTTNFAQAYYHIGAEIGRYILSKRKNP